MLFCGKIIDSELIKRKIKEEYKMAKTIKKERWEIKYEEFTSGKVAQEIEQLTEELNHAQSSEEYRAVEVKLKNATKKQDDIEKNKDKIENIIAFKKMTEGWRG